MFNKLVQTSIHRWSNSDQKLDYISAGGAGLWAVTKDGSVSIYLISIINLKFNC